MSVRDEVAALKARMETLEAGQRHIREVIEALRQGAQTTETAFCAQCGELALKSAMVDFGNGDFLHTKCIEGSRWDRRKVKRRGPSTRAGEWQTSGVVLTTEGERPCQTQ